MDSFVYGKAARGRRALGRKPLVVVLAIALLAALGWGLVAVTRSGSSAVARHARGAIEQVDASADVQAQANLRSAVSAATTTFMDGGSFASAGPTELEALEPSFRYVDGTHPSTGPEVLSVEATDQAWGGAVLSSSGTCFYIRSVGTSQAYGSGDADVCTGSAAMAATGSHF